MNLHKVDQHNTTQLFAYWQEIGKDIPYFFNVKEEDWVACLFKDTLGGDEIFRELETYFIEEEGKTLGFIQYGEPNFKWDTKGNRVVNEDIAVIRNIYFNEGREDVGRALLEKAKKHFKTKDYSLIHSFYHIMGMSCNENHGKLHESKLYVEKILLEEGFEVEHENVYYTIDMRTYSIEKDNGVEEMQTTGVDQYNQQYFTLHHRGQKIGTAQITYIKDSDITYLKWIWLEENHRGIGLGSVLLHKMFESLLNKGYRYLHTDTANNNFTAQRFYEKNGFSKEGITRSYLRKGF